MQAKLQSEISALNEQIAHQPNNLELFYQRGFLYFLADDIEKAKEDYKYSVSLGLDTTELPYYSFSNSNEKRRPFLLPEKLMVGLILIMIFTALALQVYDFISKFKGF